MLALVVDDDEKIVRVLEAYLVRAGYTVEIAFDGLTALEKAKQKPDIILLDLMLPDLDGISVCREIRKHSKIPIIMLTARDSENDRITGLEIGADDYVVKPFSPREVMARIKAVLRRSNLVNENILSYGGIRLDIASRNIEVKGNLIELTPTEFKLLELFLRYPNRVFSRLQLIERIQDVAFEGYERTVDTHVKNLRKKIGDFPSEPHYIKTVYGVGYKFVGDK